MTVHLDTEDLLHLIDDLGVGPIRDLGLLDSAAHRPSSWVLGTEAYDVVIAIADGSMGATAAAEHLSRWTGRLD